MSTCLSDRGRNSPLVKGFLGGTALGAAGLGGLIVFCAEGLGWLIVFCGGADFLAAELGLQGSVCGLMWASWGRFVWAGQRPCPAF